MAKLYRLPFGASSQLANDELHKLGYTPVLWNADADARNPVRLNGQGNKIILMHANGTAAAKHTAGSLPGTIAANSGTYQFVKVSDMLKDGTPVFASPQTLNQHNSDAQREAGRIIDENFDRFRTTALPTSILPAAASPAASVPATAVPQPQADAAAGSLEAPADPQPAAPQKDASASHEAGSELERAAAPAPYDPAKAAPIKAADKPHPRPHRRRSMHAAPHPREEGQETHPRYNHRRQLKHRHYFWGHYPSNYHGIKSGYGITEHRPHAGEVTLEVPGFASEKAKKDWMKKIGAPSQTV